MAQITIDTIITCIYNYYMWSKLSHVAKKDTCGQKRHMWSKKTHVVTFVTHGHNCHM